MLETAMSYQRRINPVHRSSRVRSDARREGPKSKGAIPVMAQPKLLFDQYWGENFAEFVTRKLFRFEYVAMVKFLRRPVIVWI